MPQLAPRHVAIECLAVEFQARWKALYDRHQARSMRLACGCEAKFHRLNLSFVSVAARRLLIVMLVLLGISTLAAALVPAPEDRNGDDETTSTASTASVPEAAAAPAEPEGRLLPPVAITVGGKFLPVVPIQLGDQIELTICSQRTDLVEIPKLGLFEAISPESPARVDVRPEAPGSYGINFVSDGSPAARIDVSDPKKGAPAESDRAGKAGRCERAQP